MKTSSERRLAKQLRKELCLAGECGHICVQGIGGPLSLSSVGLSQNRIYSQVIMEAQLYSVWQCRGMRSRGKGNLSDDVLQCQG